MSELDSVVKQIKKDYGESTAQKGVECKQVPRLSTGIFALDVQLGGGYPLGRIVEVFGPESSGKSTLALLACIQAQKTGDVVYIDVEHTFDPTWAESLGVDCSKIILLQPVTAEQAADMVEGVLSCDSVSMVVLDSVAQMTKQGAIDKTSDIADVGGNSAIVTRMVAKAVASFSREAARGHNPILFCVNQIRNKIGVMFGNPECLHSDTMIPFVDGTAYTIKQVVDGKIDKEVWGFDEESCSFVPSKINGYFKDRKGPAKDGDFLTITSTGVGTRNGVVSITSSRTHWFLTDSGWRQAKDLKVGTGLVTKYSSFIKGQALDFIRGCLCGDATLLNKGNTGAIAFQDCRNPEYVSWKIKALSEKVTFTKSASRFVSDWSVDQGVLNKEFPNRNPLGMLRSFSWLGMAVWVMDDGHYSPSHKRYVVSVKRLKNDFVSRKAISDRLNNLGLQHGWGSDGSIRFTVESSCTIAHNIREFVPSCMQYKLPTEILGLGDDFKANFDEESLEIAYDTVTSITEASSRKYRDRSLYDLSIEGCNTYLCGNKANGVVVHNTTPGGYSLKFNASIRIRMSGKDEFDKAVSEELPTWKHTTGSIIKHKVPIVSKSFEYDLCLIPHGSIRLGGTDEWSAVSRYAKKHGLIIKGDKQGQWFCLGSDGELEEYKTMVQIESRFTTDSGFAQHLKQLVYDKELGLEQGK